VFSAGHAEELFSLKSTVGEIFVLVLSSARSRANAKKGKVHHLLLITNQEFRFILQLVLKFH
jgi:hypothetical protein